MTIVYEIGSSLYLNITNKCPCSCEFCVRNFSLGITPGETLWLDYEPDISEIIAVVSKVDLSKYKEIVFCGFGEPTEQLDNLLECAKFLKTQCNLPIRLNTNGLSDLINEKDTVPLLAQYIDKVSISLNAPDKDMYNKLCDPVFGDRSYDALIQFIKDCKKHMPSVAVTVVGSVLDEDSMAKCRDLCSALKVNLTVR